MGEISVVVTDATGARRNDVSVPDDAPSARIIAKLVEVLKLPLVAPDGQPMSYRFHHVQSARQLRDDQSLSASGVASGDTLRLVPEITAG
ncbi:MAG: hypothetical protein QG671_2354 [Actinomycetota bacterium]|nr:hypothetical protein [Actinomycetota bacterium]